MCHTGGIIMVDSWSLAATIQRGMFRATQPRGSFRESSGKPRGFLSMFMVEHNTACRGVRFTVVDFAYTVFILNNMQFYTPEYFEVCANPFATGDIWLAGRGRSSTRSAVWVFELRTDALWSLMKLHSCRVHNLARCWTTARPLTFARHARSWCSKPIMISLPWLYKQSNLFFSSGGTTKCDSTFGNFLLRFCFFLLIFVPARTITVGLRECIDFFCQCYSWSNEIVKSDKKTCSSVIIALFLSIFCVCCHCGIFHGVTDNQIKTKF